MKKILVTAIFILAATVFFHDSLVFALEGQIGIHDSYTVIFCDGKHYINCPREMRDVRLSVGSNAASVWWVNSKEVIGIYGDRQTVIDDGVSERFTLNKGPNLVRAAIVNGGGATDFCARFLDAEDKPLREITVSLGKLNATPSH